MIRTNFRLSTISVVMMLTMAGCSLAPVYERPVAPIDQHYPGQPAAGTNASAVGAQAAADLGWTEFFRDPRLQDYIRLALDNNRDMRIAIQQVEEAKAQYGIVESDRYPGFGIGGNGQITRNPPDLRQGGPDAQSVSRYYQAGLGMTSFELDFFGRVRNLSEAARQQFLATTEARRTVQINVVAMVAEAYFRLRTAQDLITLIDKTQQARVSSYNLVESRFNAGIASALDLYQARSQLDAIQAEKAAIQRQYAQAGNALQLLVGTTIDAATHTGITFGRDQLVAEIPVGLPSDLLERRPDIMGAENRLLAANANIGAAKAAFFPNISITGLLGFASPQLGGLFSGGNRFWQFSPQIQMPLFSGGVKGGLDLAEARNNIAVAQYEKTIQTAFREVADALSGEATYQQQLDALRSLESSATETLRLAKLRYETGIDSFLQVQSAEVSLYDTQRNFLEIGLASLMNRVELYKALGGGWQENTITVEAATQANG